MIIYIRYDIMPEELFMSINPVVIIPGIGQSVLVVEDINKAVYWYL